MTMSKDIISKMILDDINYKTLRHMVCKFMPVSEEQIKNVVRGTQENKNTYILTAYVLGLNKYVPKDFDPTKLNPPKRKPKLKVKKPIPLYKQNFQERIENKALINKITDGVGSVLKVSEILNCTYSTVLSWKRVRKDDCVYIPPKYIIPVIKLCEEYDIDIDEYDLTSMLPTQKKKLFSDIKDNKSMT
jgi:hypothetical protein